jgi:hypothetical protein
MNEWMIEANKNKGFESKLGTMGKLPWAGKWTRL